MNRDYTLDKVRNFGIIAPITATVVASWETHGFPNPSSTGKLQFSRPLSNNVRDYK